MSKDNTIKLLDIENSLILTELKVKATSMVNL
jgi:hypothetical protein